MSNEYSNYYRTFNSGIWAKDEEDKCPCHGSGWALSDLDTWHTCPTHYDGQLSPDERDSIIEGGMGDNATEADIDAAVEKAEAESKARYVDKVTRLKNGTFFPPTPIGENDIPF